MKRILLLVFVILGFAFSLSLENMKNFFSRQGYVVEKLGNKVIVDMGRGEVFAGEELIVFREGKKLVHPITGEVLGAVEEEAGILRIEEVKEKFSIATIVEDRGIEKGLKVRPNSKDVCFEGSEEGFFRVSSFVEGVRKGKGCAYLIREFEEGFGVEFQGKALAFFEKPSKRPPISEGEYRIKDFRLEARFLMSLPSLPLGADMCNFFGRDRNYLAVLFEDKIVFYEVLPKELIEYTTLRLPAGEPVGIVCAPLSGEEDVVLVNMISGTRASSLVVRFAGGTPVVVKEGIPFIMGVLDKSRARETFIGQKFDARDLWGEVRKLELSGDDIVVGELYDVPSEFRIDSAVALGDLLVFTDIDSYLRVYRGKELILSQQDFGGSYTSVELPGSYEDDEKYTFNTRHFILSLKDKALVGVVRNLTSAVYKFLDVTKFSEGELYLLTIDDRGKAELKKVEGKKFEEAIQAVVNAGKERLFVFTGRTGTFPMQNKGDLFEVIIEPY